MYRKFPVLNLLLFLLPVFISAQSFQQQFITSDLQNFWNAYDQIVQVKDTVQQQKLLQELYLNKASEGLNSLILVRDYSNHEFLNAITRYPKFWASIRKNMQISFKLHQEIEADILKLKQVYPPLQHTPIYFLAGAFRTSGTTYEKKILIGAELSLADPSTVVEELPAWRQPFYKETNPIKDLALLCTHEYVHIQQKELVHNLLSKCLYEGIAEFVSCKATGKLSTLSAIPFGKANQQAVLEQFVKDLFTMDNDFNWMWGQNNNHLKVRDLGYYIGYEIAERYYNLSTNKTKAIKELVELDYTNEKAVEQLVDTTVFLPEKLSVLEAKYEQQRPFVQTVSPFKNGSKTLKPGQHTITVTFSEPLNGYNAGMDYGPSGENTLPKISPERTWSADKKSYSFKVELEPNRQYQLLLTNAFRNENGIRLKPFLLEFKTKQ